MIQTVHLLLLLLAAGLHVEPCSCQVVPGEYPSPISVATYRPVTSSSVCGANGAENYCRYTTDATASLGPNCILTVCNNTCPFSSSSPPPIPIATLGTLGPGVTTTNGRPGATTGALRFVNSSVNTSEALVPILDGRGFSFAAWINQDEGNTGTLISKATPDGLDRNYVLSINQSSITFDYLPATLSLPPGALRYRSVFVNGLSLHSAFWHHIAVTVYAEDAAFYVNGTIVSVDALEGEMVDERRVVFLGQTIDSVGYYNGLMQEVYLYTQALTAREVTELVTGSLPFAHLSTECHCPPSHPVIDPDSGGDCIQHSGGNLVSRGSAQRINSLAHPPGFINDFGTFNGWISEPGVREVNITLHLTNSLYELIFINFRYGSPRPKAMVLETSKDGGVTFQPIQYFADDCMFYFGLPDDGQIVNADDANCITTASMQSPAFSADVRTRLLDPQTRNFNLNTSPELRLFLLGSHLQLRLIDFFNESATPLHLYYSILEVTVAARCACNGHSSRCGTDIDSVCQCVHNTEGDNCERCAPLYNDKPWRYGITSNGFPCKLCNCNRHASSCHYNTSIDPFPDSYDVGGGGMCDNCQDNTAGQHCETCRYGYYRPPGRQPSDPSPCVACSCDARGIVDEGDCVKSEGIGGVIAGQCYCKTNVIGLNCDTCREGFFGLSSDNPTGCEPCGCNTAGTFDASISCASQTGQCLCKENVNGLKCDQCLNGTTGLNALNPLGCSECTCNLIGSVSNNCNPLSGACTCKPGVGGPICDQCLQGYFGFSDAGCQPCTCHSEGAVSNICSSATGECTCRDNVTGTSCDSCASGFYNISASCVPCGCNTAGTLGGNTTCDMVNGQCECKLNVEGRTCSTCSTGFTNLTAPNPDGCSACSCFMPNTDTSGIVCDPVTSQCECDVSATGLQCGTCRDGFYFTPGGCIPCNCSAQGSASSVCDMVTGQCTCVGDGVGGRVCDRCLPGFFQFPNCISCGCDPAGAIATTQCNPQTGACQCKLYVTGATCNSCTPGFQMLEANNPFGCSAAPDEQAPPTAMPLNFASILLQWSPPEASNGVILGYNVYRNGSFIANTSSLNYTDTGLMPDSTYSYFIEAFNIIGSTTSASIFTQTLEGVPSGITPPTLLALNSSAVQALWQVPTVTNGIVGRYELVLAAIEDQPMEEVVFTGLMFSSTVTGLMPFTVYTFVVRACTSGGCGSSGDSPVRTAQAPPTFQPAPNVTTLSPMTVEVSWYPPPEPNGIIDRYEIFQRNASFGDGFFVGSVPNGTLSLVVGGLRPFTQYEFHVVSYTAGGGTQSEWSQGSTAASVPEGVLSPTLTPLSPFEIQVNWTEPLTPNGIITRYGVYMVSIDMATLPSRILLLFSSESGSLVVQQLQPFTEYGFQLEACTNVGCSDSDNVTRFTLESAPIGQGPPTVVNVTATSVNLEWDTPTLPNGIITNYVVQRRRPSLSPSPAIRDVGIAFNGNGFATFAPGSVSFGGSVSFNEISLRFRTFRTGGTIVYYINAARTDYLAIELRLGVPWFFFDAGSGPAAIRPDTDVSFNDGLWHEIAVRQEGQTGTITIDGLYTGTGNSIGSDQVITANQVLYIGAIPPNIPHTTQSGNLNPNATLDGIDFIGCLFGVTLNGQLLDFSAQADSNPGVDIGCPVGVERGASLLGAGYIVLQENTITDSSFVINYDLRTTHTRGFIFFAHTGDNASLAIELCNSSLCLVTSSASGLRDEISVGSNSFCDGQWHSLSIEQQENQVFLSVDGTRQSLTLPQSNTVFSSRLYIGGAPQNSVAFAIASGSGLDVNTPFSGCIRFRAPNYFVNGTAIIPVPDEVQSVRFDGCHNSTESLCVPPWVSRDVGQVTAATDEGLHPFTDYLYRISAQNSAGSGISPWVDTMTEESAPSGVGAPELLSRTSSSLTLTWQRPTVPNGLIVRYDVTAIPVITVGLDSPLGSITMVTVEVREPEMVLMANLTGLEPATTHSLYLTAYTAASGGTGSTVAIATLESVPVGVLAPFVMTADSRELELAWNTPTQPNGIIIRYDLFVNDQLQLSTPNTSATVDNLEPFTENSFFLQACTAVGCGNSSTSTGQTLPDRPMGLAAPNLTALSPSSIQATWELPANPNGIILRFELRIFMPDRSQNFSGMDFETTISGLTPNTLYMFQLLAFNAGGSTASPIVEEQTLEDIPDGITAPDIEVVNSTALHIMWQEPSEPNGEIIRYILTQNGTNVFSGVSLSYLATNLNPFSFYSYSIMACTVRGCGSSNQSSERTPEDVPEGYIEPTISMVTASSITIVINPVTNPNGVVRYMLYILGEFAIPGAGPSDTISETRVVYNSSETETVEIGDLLPFSSYEFTLSIVNSAGNLTGEPFTVRTEAAAPMGLSAPMLTLQDNATTVHIQWAPPTRLNGPLRYYQVTLTNASHTLIFNVSLDTFLVVGDLRPFTYYEVFVTVVNMVGSADSPTSNITTGETAPSGFDQAVVFERGPRYLLLSWDPPAAANGLLVNYTVLEDGNTLASVPFLVMEYNVSSLLPFTMYDFSVVVCTSAGCVESPSVIAMTLEDVPEGVPAPVVLDGVASTVLLSWATPTSLNGVILEYQVERMGSDDNNFTVIGTVVGNASRVFVDTNTLPFTTYEYRIVAVNGAGSTTGPSATFTTSEAAPSDVLPPILTALSSSSINVRFLPPLAPNGIIISYTLTRSTPLAPTPTTIPLNTTSLPVTNGSFFYTDMNLLPFTNYTYVLTVCTNGGCTNSSPVQEITLESTPQGISVPTAIVQNSTAISVSWVAPTQPNGVIQSYDLLRRDLGFSNSTIDMMVTNCCEEYLSSQAGSGRNALSEGCNYITQTSSDITTHIDATLQAYSFYQYCTITSNNADSAHSELSPPTQTDPAPMPAVGPQLNTSTVNSTSIYLSWGSLDISQLLGPLVGYTLYGRVALTVGLGEVLFTGLDQSYTATGLVASTEYAFVVAVSNGRGPTLGNTATAITEEGIPTNLSAPVVDALNSSSLSIEWREPQQPNGIIIIYTIFLDSMVLHNQSDPGILVVSGLTPFTVYTIRVEACTQFGCTRSPLVSERTLESAPVSLASPVVLVTGPTSSNISWNGPVQPNGNITNYQLLRRDPNGDTLLIFFGLAFEFLATNLRPFTTYGFEVIAFNSAGNVSSGFTTVRTEETAPSFVAPPILTVLSENEILLSWTRPAELNGDLLGYQIYLSGMFLQTTLLTSYSHTGLEPFTEYTYVLEACTNGGCTNSSTVSNMTFEALPEGVSNLVILQLQARSLTLTWQPPIMPNGIITEYILTLRNNNTVLFRGLAFSHSITELTPFTSFSFLLQTCNSIGCVPSSVVEVRTPETNPEGLEAPRLRNLTSTSVEIQWSAPSFPNGNITNYILRRGNESSVEMTVVFQGVAFSYNDVNLVADTLYLYTVEAVNGGGSVESSPSYIRTSPDSAEGIQPPSLDVLGPTSIRVSWSPPQSPNGVISRYVLYMNSIPVFTGIGFEYTALGLTPFTLYSFYFEVCNQVGCAGSITVSDVTDQSFPQGVTPPTLNVLGATAIEVSWQLPTMPNGIITMYEIRRRLFNDPLTESIQHRSGPSVLSFPNSGLNPFTRYEYRLRVFNGAGNVFSEWVAERTLEDIPEGVSLPSFADSDILARNVTATWDPPTSPNGIIVSYRLEYRLPLDPLTNLPGIPVTAADVPGNVTTATAVGLLPVMIYEFRVVAINGAGEGEGNFETVTTREDVPEGLQQIIVEERTGISLTLTWSPPLMQNGVIREYLLYVDGDLVYRDSPRTYMVLRLQPFTSYNLQLAACTSAGCTFGSIQSATTAETAPFGQPTPTLTAQSPRIVEVVWNNPAQPNGIITRYEILRQDNGFPSTLVVISSTNDTLSRRYLDTTVLPASDYQYAIRAINSAGQTEGAFRAIVTPEAPPEGLTAPVLTVTSSSSILVTWNPPTQSNGIITEYQAFRSGGGMTNISVYRGQNRIFTDTGLQPFTLYTYTIQGCTSGGCSQSPNTSATTLEASPADFAAPILQALSATEISLRWDPPRMPNGIITHYLVNILPVSITVRTTQLAVNITNLLPFTLYTINIDSCNLIGCVTSSGQIRTLESLPQFINAPQLSTIDPFTIQVSWQEPARPNGVIIRYELRRNNTVRETFNGSVVSFIDMNLMPDSFYSYTIQAFTSVGSGDISAPSVTQTPPDTPEDIAPPILEVLDANSIRARWSVPGTPNGIIRSYMLEVNGSVVFTGLAFEYIVDNLSPFTVYSFGLVVCTSTCGRSQVVTQRTDEAPPAGQAPPQLVANPNTTVTVAWNEPAVLNGVIRYYEVERRQVLEGGVRSRFAVVYNDSATRFLDTSSQLLPATMYEYRVIAVNGGGRITSEVSLVMLLDAPPIGVYPPMIENVTSVSLSVLLVPPLVPNGMLTDYRLYQDGIQIHSTAPGSQTSTVIFRVTGLQPFTTYVFHAEVCTAGGCNSSQVVSARTGEAQPTGLDTAPMAVVLSSRSINVSWVPPSQPNGEIVRYTLWFRLTCPQPEQPNQPVCTTPGPRTLATSNIPGTAMLYLFTGSGSDDPIPYSAYQFQIEAANSVGSVTSPYSTSVTTDASTPEPIQTGLQFSSDQENRLISLNWSRAFNLNSRLIHYIVSRNGISVQQLQETQVTLTLEPVGMSLEYVITAVTETGRVSLDPIVLQLGDTQVTGPTESPTATTPTITLPTEATPFYREAAFIIGMVVLGVILLFTACSVFLCCVRPKGNKGYKVTDPYIPLTTPPTTPLTTPTKSGFKRVQRRQELATDSWTPGDPSWEIPDLGEEHMEPVMVPSARSYSPKKAEATALLDHEVLEPTLPDTQIKSYTNPQQFIPAQEDFGSFRASQTTFADTKV